MCEIKKIKNEMLILFNDIYKNTMELKIKEYSPYYIIEEENYMWTLRSNQREIRVFLSEEFGLIIEFGEKTFGKERFWEKAKELQLSDSVFETYDQLYPPQEVFENKIPEFNLDILKDELIKTFKMS